MHRGHAITSEGVSDVRSRGYLYPNLDGFGVWDEAGSTITWKVIELEAGKTYALPIRARSFHDLSGNECEVFDLIFTVAGED